MGNKADAAQEIIDILTGFNTVCLDIDEAKVPDIVERAFDNIRPYLSSPVMVETVACISSTDESCYIPKSSLGKTLDYVEKVYPTERISAVSSDFLGLPGFLIASSPQEIIGGAGQQRLLSWAEWLSLKQQLVEAFRESPDFREIGDNILVHPSFDRLTLEYHYTYANFDEVVETLIIEFVEDWALAMTKIIVGEVRRKYSGGPINFELNGDALVSEGREDLAKLEEALPNLTPNLEPL